MMAHALEMSKNCSFRICIYIYNIYGTAAKAKHCTTRIRTQNQGSRKRGNVDRLARGEVKKAKACKY